MNNAICQNCFNLDCPQPCVATDNIIINCLYTEMVDELKTCCGFDFENHANYKKLAPALSKQVRTIYKKYTDMLELDPAKPLYTHNGIKIAEGFERMAIGDYGAYIEYDLAQVPKGMKYAIEPGQEYRKLPNWRNRVKYIWYTIPNSDPHIKIYWQLRTVSYADYKIKKFYISPFEIMQ